MKIVLQMILFLFVFVILVLGMAIVTSNLWVNRAVAAVINQVTDLPVTIDQVRINLNGPEFGIYGIKIKNPKGFADETLASIPEIFIDFDLGPFLSEGKIHFETIRLNLNELSINRNEQGLTNLSSLKTLKRDKSKTIAGPDAPKPKVKRHFLVDQFILTIGNVRYSDRSLPVPVSHSVDVNINKEVFRGVTNLGDMIRLILRKILYNASFSTLGAPVDLLKYQFGSSLLRGQEVITESTEFTRLMGTQVLGEGRRIVESATSKIPVTVPVLPEVNQITEKMRGKATGLFQGAERFVKNTTDTLTEKIGEKTNSSK